MVTVTHLEMEFQTAIACSQTCGWNLRATSPPGKSQQEREEKAQWSWPVPWRQGLLSEHCLGFLPEVWGQCLTTVIRLLLGSALVLALLLKG